ncbi:MAG: hypothetical protein ACT4OW_01935 [Nitrososphaerota archaeon]
MSMIKNSSKRAVSEIIVTLLLLGITVVGGILIWSTLSGSQQQISLETEVQDIGGSERDIIIVGYDTRDGQNLGGLTDIDNSNPSSGTLISGEYIVVTLRDRAKGDILIDKVSVNEIEHTWQSGTSCTLSTTPTIGCSINNGQFIIINSPIPPSASKTVNESQLVLEGSDFNLVIRLGSDVSTISLNKAIRLSVVVANFDPTNFIITSGGTR